MTVRMKSGCSATDQGRCEQEGMKSACPATGGHANTAELVLFVCFVLSLSVVFLPVGFASISRSSLRVQI